MRGTSYIEPDEQLDELAAVRAELIRSGLVLPLEAERERETICLCAKCLRERYLGQVV